MIEGHLYMVKIKIKLHTKPLREISYFQWGVLTHETKKSYCFNGFRVKKENVVKISEFRGGAWF